MSITLRLYKHSGEFLRHLPLRGTVEVQAVLNEEGSASITYPADAPDAQALKNADLGAVAILDEGVEIFRFLVEDDTDDPAQADPAQRYVTVGGPGVLAMLAWGITTPEAGLTRMPHVWTFNDATPGRIMRDLLERMQSLECLTHITPTFTGLRDSAGTLWPETTYVSYAPGRDLLTVVKDLGEQGLAEVRMRGTQLDLYVPDTELQRDQPQTFIRRAHVQSSPRKRSRKELRSHFLVAGEDGLSVAPGSATTMARYGKRFGYAGEGMVTNRTRLVQIGRQMLKQHGKPTAGYEHTLRLSHPTCPRPFRELRLGDMIRSDFAVAENGLYEPVRVRTLTLSLDSEGVKSGSIELNDRFTEALQDIAKKIEGIRHGARGSTTGGPDPFIDDTGVPKAPEVVEVSTSGYTTDQGYSLSLAHVQWSTVALNTDGGEATDLLHYRVQWNIDGQGWGSTSEVRIEEALEGVFREGIPVGSGVQARVQVLDRNGNRSEWATSRAVRAVGDTEAPPAPSTPLVEPFLGTLRASWDGLGSAGEKMPADFSYIEVHVSTSPAFVPSPTSLTDSMSAAGASIIDAQEFGVPHYVRFVAVDEIGNRSEPSAAGEGVPEPLVDTAAIRDEVDRAMRDIEIGGGNLLRNSRFAISGQSWSLGSPWQAESNQANSFGVFGPTYAALNGVTSTSLATLSQATPSAAAGEPHVASVWAWRSSTAADVTLVGQYVDAAGSGLGTVTAASLLEVSSYERLKVVLPDAPAGAARVLLQVRGRSSSGTAVTVRATHAQVEVGKVPTAYAPRPEEILPGSITRTEIADNAITTPKLVSGSVITGHLAAGAVTAQKMAAGSITAENAALANLSVITAKIGELDLNSARVSSLSAAKITTGTLTADLTMAGRIKTADTGARVWIDATGVRVWQDSGSIPAIHLKANGLPSTIRGEILAEIFRTRSYANGGNYIELGKVAGDLDPGDEMRMVTGTSAVNMRNTPAKPGALTISTRSSSLSPSVQFRLSPEMGWELPNGFNIQGPTAGVHFTGQRVNFRFTTGTSFSSRSGGVRAWFEFPPANGVGASARLVFANEGCSLKGFSSRVEVRNGGDSTFARGLALSWDLASDSRIKRNVVPVRPEQQSAALGARACSYETVAEPGRARVGYLAEELPEEVRDRGNSSGIEVVDLYGLMALKVEALQAWVETLEGQLVDAGHVRPRGQTAAPQFIPADPRPPAPPVDPPTPPPVDPPAPEPPPAPDPPQPVDPPLPPPPPPPPGPGDNREQGDTGRPAA